MLQRGTKSNRFAISIPTRPFVSTLLVSRFGFVSDFGLRISDFRICSRLARNTLRKAVPHELQMGSRSRVVVRDHRPARQRGAEIGVSRGSRDQSRIHLHQALAAQARL